mmetsp:Transcript_1619/g.3790  ORF Transcript_1619/g.3790 Transcript_1619/m.3790 type:complete len:247 (+) Transcript_1619:1717-2457(+)
MCSTVSAPMRPWMLYSCLEERAVVSPNIVADCCFVVWLSNAPCVSMMRRPTRTFLFTNTSSSSLLETFSVIVTVFKNGCGHTHMPSVHRLAPPRHEKPRGDCFEALAAAAPPSPGRGVVPSLASLSLPAAFIHSGTGNSTSGTFLSSAGGPIVAPFPSAPPSDTTDENVRPLFASSACSYSRKRRNKSSKKLFPVRYAPITDTTEIFSAFASRRFCATFSRLARFTRTSFVCRSTCTIWSGFIVDW